MLSRRIPAVVVALAIASCPAAAENLTFGDREEASPHPTDQISLWPPENRPEGASAPPVAIEVLSEYLRSIDTLVTTFSQENSDGTTSSGTLYIDRPFRARLAYSPPDPALIIANSGQVAVFDRKSNTGPNIFPLRRTPFHAILTRSSDLSDPKFLIGHYASDETSEIHLRSGPNNVKAVVKLIFRNRPVSLIGWTVVDEFGNQVAVTLRNILYGPELDPILFDIEKEAERQGKS